MNVVVLAAGTGSRLRPYTNSKPKALVELAGKPLLEHQLDVFSRLSISDVSLVTGYLSDHFSPYNLTQHINPLFDQSNMVYSLMKASSLFDLESDLIISYGDIIYEDSVLEQLIRSAGDVVVSADSHWLDLWSLRMEDPLSDAESFDYDKTQLKLKSLGKKIETYEQAQAQYIGLIKIKSSVLKLVKNIYDALPAEQSQNMYLTDFITLLINKSLDVRVSIHSRGWLEVDTQDDLHTYQGLIRQQKFTELGFKP
jgi:choline kinase